MTIARFAAVAAITFAGLFGAGLTDGIAAAAPEQTGLGPYEQLATCERQGNLGMENGEWADYTCEGTPGAWYIKPQY